MSALAPPASGTLAAATTLLSRTRSALDGIPAEALLNDCLQAPTRDRAAQLGARSLAEHIPGRWRATIESDLGRFPAPTTDVLERIQRRMADTRDALLQLQWLLDDVAGQTAVATTRGTPAQDASRCAAPAGSRRPAIVPVQEA